MVVFGNKKLFLFYLWSLFFSSHERVRQYILLILLICTCSNATKCACPSVRFLPFLAHSPLSFFRQKLGDIVMQSLFFHRSLNGAILGASRHSSYRKITFKLFLTLFWSYINILSKQWAFELLSRNIINILLLFWGWLGTVPIPYSTVTSCKS